MQSCKIYSLEVADPNELCSQIIHATEAGIDLGDLLDSCLLTLFLYHTYEGNRQAFENSAAHRYLEDNGLVLKVLENKKSNNLQEFFSYH